VAPQDSLGSAKTRGLAIQTSVPTRPPHASKTPRIAESAITPKTPRTRGVTSPVSWRRQ
jgi:hypothetical protein